MNREMGITVLMVLHDLNMAARYSDRLVVLHEGNVYRQGTPTEVLCEETLKTVFGIEARVLTEAGIGPLAVIPLQAKEEEEE